MKLSPKRQIVVAVLALLLLGLQARLWLGEGSVQHKTRLEAQVAALNATNAELSDRNRLMSADVRGLKEGLDAVEEIARKDLGMIREGETFYMVVDGDGEAHADSR